MEIIILRKKQSFKCLIDDEDYPLVKEYNWKITHQGYVRSSGKHGIFMHRLIMGVHENRYPLVDHINFNTVDNRKENLRLVSYKGNASNRRPKGMEPIVEVDHKGIKSKRVNFLFDAKVYDEIEAAAKEDTRSLTSFVLVSCENHLEYRKYRYFSHLMEMLIQEVEAAWKLQLEPYSDVDINELNQLIEQFEKH